MSRASPNCEITAGLGRRRAGGASSGTEPVDSDRDLVESVDSDRDLVESVDSDTKGGLLGVPHRQKHI
jgi:hypothetical protein